MDRERTLTRKQAAEFLEVSISTLARWASAKEGPPYLVIGNKSRYRIPDLNEYMESCRRR